MATFPVASASRVAGCAGNEAGIGRGGVGEAKKRELVGVRLPLTTLSRRLCSAMTLLA